MELLLVSSNQHCHRPLYAGDPFSFLNRRKKWVARTSRAMTIFIKRLGKISPKPSGETPRA